MTGGGENGAPPFVPFRAPWWLASGQLQTWGAVLAPIHLPDGMPPDEPHEVSVAPGSRVRVLVTPASGTPQGTLLLLHGLAGHASSRLLRRGAGEAWRRGWTVVRMNYRSCGGTAPLASTLCNAGMSGDIASVLESPLFASLPQPRVAIGYSLGGNMLLKYLGEAAPQRDGETAFFKTAHFAEDGPGRAGRHLHHAGRGSRLAGAVAVSPPIDLSLTCRNLERPPNIAYHLLFTAVLARRARHRHRLDGRTGPAPALWRTPTMRRFDTRHTAPDAGYATTEDYYRGASAISLLNRIDTPTLIVTAKDDPIMPIAMFAPPIERNPFLRLVISNRGGHCGWIERREGRIGNWLPALALDFLETEARPRTDPALRLPAGGVESNPAVGGSSIVP